MHQLCAPDRASQQRRSRAFFNREVWHVHLGLSSVRFHVSQTLEWAARSVKHVLDRPGFASLHCMKEEGLIQPRRDEYALPALWRRE